jgi:hypothetical protein
MASRKYSLSAKISRQNPIAAFQHQFANGYQLYEEVCVPSRSWTPHLHRFAYSATIYTLDDDSDIHYFVMKTMSDVDKNLPT